MTSTIDFDNRMFKASDGTPINSRGIEDIVRRSDPKGFGNDAGIGEGTAKRAIVTHSAQLEVDRRGLGLGAVDGLGVADLAHNAPDSLLYSQPLVDEGAHEAATCPLNDESEPTDAQKEAGNYRMGHVKVGGLDISVENPSVRHSFGHWTF